MTCLLYWIIDEDGDSDEWSGPLGMTDITLIFPTSVLKHTTSERQSSYLKGKESIANLGQ